MSSESSQGLSQQDRSKLFVLNFISTVTVNKKVSKNTIGPGSESSSKTPIRQLLKKVIGQLK